MSENGPPIVAGRAPTESERQLFELFDAIEANQLDLLDQSGKRIAELTGVLLGVLVGVMTFGDTWPPPYLAQNAAAKALFILGVVLYLLAMLWGLLTVNPRRYKRYRHNLTGMREELDQIIANKSRTLTWAGICFFGGSIMLGALLALLVFSA